MPDDSPAEPTCYVARAFTSPLLADPEWVAGFRWFGKQLLSIARDLQRYDSMPSYRDALLKTKWCPYWEGLALHLKKVVDAGRNGPAISAYAMDGGVYDAFQLACAAMDESGKRSTPTKTPIPLTALEGINELLNRSEPAPPPTGDAMPEAAGADAAAPPSGTKPDRIQLDPAKTSFGQACHLLGCENGRFMALVLTLAEGRQLKRYANSQLGKTLPDAIDDIRKLLARRLGMEFDEVDMMPLADAVRIILEPEAAGINTAALPLGTDSPEPAISRCPLCGAARDNRNPACPICQGEILRRAFGPLASIAAGTATPKTPTPSAPPEGESKPAAPASGTEAAGIDAATPEAPAIDYDALIVELAKQSKRTQAALVRFMKDKNAAEIVDIADKVHGNSDVTEEAMAKNARETTASLVGLGSRLSFRVAGGMMHKEISPE